ncbi:hypothetical protein LTR28_007835, partial [Elasticomyces elasticus]
TLLYPSAELSATTGPGPAILHDGKIFFPHMPSGSGVQKRQCNAFGVCRKPVYPCQQCSCLNRFINNCRWDLGPNVIVEDACCKY